ncbi:hypothetical protein ACIBG8_15985 [Nonomuraea sp. NPDC050556]|uniref:hypothetical protein n=1 Tax=Nonomuraea sp. NPDC050556 TaxID=3364369 RepID=UPI00378A1F2B
MRKVLVWFTLIQLVLVLLQFYLATFGAFERPVPAVGSEDAAIGWHAINGIFVIPVFSLITTILALVARSPGKLTLYASGPLLMALVQMFVIFPLAELAGGTETKTSTASLVVMGFHALVGVVMLGAAVLAFTGARTQAGARSVSSV